MLNNYGWLIAIPVLFVLLFLVVSGIVFIYELMFGNDEEDYHE